MPTSVDDVYFTALSNATAYTVTVDVEINCRDMTWALPGTSGVPTFTGAKNLNIYGNLILISGMIWTTSATNGFRGTGTHTIQTNGVAMGGGWLNVWTGTRQLLDDLTISSTNGSLYNYATLDTNGRAVTFTNTRTIDIYTQTGGTPITFYDLTVIGDAGRTYYLRIWNSDITVTNNLTITGNSAVNRLLVHSYTIGTARTITVNGTVTATNADFRDITGAGTASWDFSAQNDIGGGSGTNGALAGNSGITFPTAQNAYWVAGTTGSKNWSDLTGSVGTYWMTTSGGSTKTRVPLMQDTAVFDNNSFAAASSTVVQDMPRIGSVTFAGDDGLHPVTNTPTWTTSTVASVFGSITLVSGMTLTASTQAYTFEGRGSYTLTSAGKTWGKHIIVYAPNGTYTLQDALFVSYTLYINGGTLNSGGNNVTVGILDYGSGYTRNLILGAAVWTITAWTSPINYSNLTGFTLTSSGSTINLVDTTANNKDLYIGSFIYNNLKFSGGAGGGSYKIYGTNTFTGYIKDDGTAAHAITFPNVVTTLADFQRSAGTNVITLQRTGASGTFTLTKTGGGKIGLDYITVTNSSVTPANTWYYGPNSTVDGTNTGWTLDNTAPSTTDDTDSNWHNSSVTVTLSCSDAGSGCTNTYYTTDGSTPTTSSSSGTSVVLSSSGTYTIKYFSVDATGNTEEVKTASNQVKIDTGSPTVTSFVIPSTSESLTVAISTFTATDAISTVDGYLASESASTPLSTSGNWLGSAPASYVFLTEGLKTLYAWAKDSAGNVSTSLNDSVTIAVPTYSIGGSITGLTGTVVVQNNLGNDLSIPAASSSFTFSSLLASGASYSVTVKTQPSGQTCTVSNGSGTVASANVTSVSLSCADSSAPTVSAFVIPSTSSSRVVTISTFTATDNVGVTGYLASESASTPLSTSGNWSGSAPSTYTFLTDGLKTLYAWAKDAVGNVSTSLNDSVTVDTTAPDFVNVSAGTPTSTGATITWTTNEDASSKVEYGAATSYGSTTSETDTSPRIQSHSVTLSGLLPCTTYFYRVKSKDSLLNEGVSSGSFFLTSGCSASSTVLDSNVANASSSGGGTVTLGNLALSIPASFKEGVSSAVFQVKQLDGTTFFATISGPSGKSRVGTDVFNLKALTDASTTISSFSSAPTITLTYSESDIVGLDESALTIYRYDGSEWNALSSCSTNTSAHTVTCSTTQFSDFALFGSAPTPTAAPSSGGGGGGMGSIVTHAKPTPPAGGFKILINPSLLSGRLTTAQSTKSSSVTLSLSAGSDIKRMILSNRGDFYGAPHQDFVQTKTWDLCYSPTIPGIQNPCEYGLHTVYAIFYNSLGQGSDIIQTSIEYLPTLAKSTVSKTPAKTTKTPAKPTKTPAINLPANPASSGTLFNRNLKLGSVGPDVKALQQFLNQNGFTVSKVGAGSIGKETTYYGPATRNAVIRFQDYYREQILTPAGLKKGTGIFSVNSRKFVNEFGR